MAKGTALATLSPSTALAVAANTDTSDVRGKENISRDDVILPRVAICQAMSPQKDEDAAEYLDGIKEGDLFNTVTGQIYGRGPVDFVIIRLDKRALEFEKGPDGKPTKVILDFNVPWNDKRCEFTDGENGGRTKPVATRFYDYVVFLPGTFEPAVLSMSNTKIKVARKLNSILALRPGASWAGLFKVATVKEEKNGNKYFNYKIDPAGPTPDAVVKQADALYEQFARATVSVDSHGEDAVENEADQF